MRNPASRSMSTRRAAYVIFPLLCMLLQSSLSGCTPVVAASVGTTAGVTVAQERTIGGAVDDAVINLEIDHLFLQHDVNSLFINVGVNVSEGRVLLTGSVRKIETSIDAVRLVWQVGGVREVLNEIQVKDTTSIADRARDVWINAQVKGRLIFAKGISSINYNIETVNGTVYVMGIAQNKEELGKVIRVASTTRYVREVVSHVIMKDDPRRKPAVAEESAN